MMKFTALFLCGTLLVFSSLSWTIVDCNEGDLQRDIELGPCTVTLRPEGLCRQGQDDGTCPYQISLPALTVHFPMQLRELEKIVKDLQRLKDNVDQLRKTCADCTVSQNERECAKRREREHEKMKVGMDRHADEGIWLNERNPDKQKDFIQEYGTNKFTVANTMQGFGDTDNEERETLDKKGGNNCESDKDSDKELVKKDENEESLQQVTQTYGKPRADGSKGKDKFRQPMMPSVFGNERMEDTVIQIVEQNKRERETVRYKEEDGKGNSNEDRENVLRNGKGRNITNNLQNKVKTEESDQHKWKDETKETGQKSQTDDERGRDGVKMSEDNNAHTNNERQQQGEEREMETEKGIKPEQNNEKPKQTESTWRTENEKPIEEVEVEEDRGMRKKTKKDEEKEAQGLQTEFHGGFRKATEITDFISISPTPHSSKSLSLKDDSNEAITFGSPLRSPLSSSNSLLIAGVNQGITITADGLPTTNTGLGAAGISEHPNPAEEADFRTISRPTTAAIISTVGGPGQQINSDTNSFTSTTSAGPGAGLQKQVGGPTVATTTATAPQNVYKTKFPGVEYQSHRTAKKNTSTHNVTGESPPPGREPMPSGKQKSVIKPKPNRKHKTSKNNNEPDQIPLPIKKQKQKQKQKLDQKQKTSKQKPKTNLKSKPGPDRTQTQIPKPPSTDGNLKNTKIPTQEHTIDESRLPIQKPKPHQKSTLPVQRPMPHQKPRTVNATGSDKDPRTDQEPASVETTIINQNLIPDEKLGHPLKTDKPARKKKPHKIPTSEETTKLAKRLTTNQYSTRVQVAKPERNGSSLTSKINQKPVKPLMEDSDENTSPEPKSAQDSSPGQNLTSDQALIKPDEKTQKHSDLTTLQKTEVVVNPKPGQTTQINRSRFKAPQPDQIPLDPNSVNDDIREAESNKTSWALPRHRPPPRPTEEPGTTAPQRPKTSIQIKPSPKTKTDVDLSGITRITPDDIQSSRNDMTPAPGHLEQINSMTHFPAVTDFSPNKMKTVTLSPRTSYSGETGPLPHHHTLPEGSTMSPNSRIISNLTPQTASQPPSIPMTTRPNKFMHGIPPSVIPGIRPGSKKPKHDLYGKPRLQVHNVEETDPEQTPDPNKIMIPVHPPSAQTSTATNPGNSDLQPLAREASTPSARELRVKVNQVAAVFNKSQNESRASEAAGSRPERTDGKLATRLPSGGKRSVTVAMRDCSDYLIRGRTKSAVYLVTPDMRSRSFTVPCDMDLDGGGWTLLQRRQDGSVSFNRTWTEYRSGFGKLDGGEFWLGNNKIHLLTRNRDMMLRVELEDFDGVMRYAHYELFRVASERLHYQLTVDGYSGTTGDSLRFSESYDHNHKPFTTPDRDHDRYPAGNCWAYYSSGWWFDACLASNLNGRYYVGTYKGVRDGIYWGTWHNIATEYYPTNDRQSIKSVRMMIRPKGFAT